MQKLQVDDMHAKYPEDVDETDADGNTLFHRAALAPLDDDSLAALKARAAALNVTADQPNHAGRTPMHVLCSFDWCDNEAPEGNGYVAEPIRLCLQGLQFVRHIDAADAKGVRPLHLAVTISEVCVGELLAAGADPLGATLQGLTPLHLAARARQSNIAGRLLDGIRAQGDSEAVGTAVSADDEAGWQPLHYACRSGRPETVAILLGAHSGGIDVVNANTLPALLDACAEFAQEQPLWNSYHPPTAEDASSMFLLGLEESWRHDVVGGVDRHDDLRPWVVAGQRALDSIAGNLSPIEGEDLDDNARAKEQLINFSGQVRTDQDTTQVRPILQMLYRAYLSKEQDQDTARHLFQNALHAVIVKLQNMGPPTTSALSETFYAYTLQCFCEFSSALAKKTDTNDNKDDLAAIESSNRLDSSYPHPDDGRFIVRRLLRQRRFGPLPHLLLQWATPESESRNGREISHRKRWLSLGLQSLVELGQADSLVDACVQASASDPVVRDTFYNAFHDTAMDSLLYLACCRQLPNMDVVRLLIEKCHVDANRRTIAIAERAQMLGIYEGDEPGPGLETPLHALARGFHWWGITQAIPYLIAHGADVTAKNEWGHTAFDLAWHGREKDWDRPLTRRVFELLGGKPGE
ncbi:hypothetical protein SCUCBS95973_000492 [Sporothrix curviconia]|uniref:Ankyrin repeat protein n=1 Tax=Sporothrix curviconia TaxID=1260050 RepID=A0ABP0AQQ0_9PEZI